MKLSARALGQPMALRQEGAHRGGCRVGGWCTPVKATPANEADLKQSTDLLRSKERASVGRLGG